MKVRALTRGGLARVPDERDQCFPQEQAVRRRVVESQEVSRGHSTEFFSGRAERQQGDKHLKALQRVDSRISRKRATSERLWWNLKVSEECGAKRRRVMNVVGAGSA